MFIARVTHGLELVKAYRIYIFSLSILFLVCGYKSSFIQEKIKSYANSNTQSMFGGSSLAPEQERKIKNIAQKLGISQTIHIRKMNAQTLQQYGYHNAFAYFPRLLGIVPVGSEAFMYVSEGFFEDLDPEEQEFLIGHELAHIQQGHTRYAAVVYFLLVIVMSLGIWWALRKYQILGNWLAKGALWIVCMVSLNLAALYYRRHIEWEADLHAIERLSAHNGMMKITQRWLKEHKMPLHEDYFGLLSHHPSVWQRQAYCLESQKNHKGS